MFVVEVAEWVADSSTTVNCPTCAHPENRVLRTVENRRQRECLRCRFRWWTREIPEVEAARVSRIIDQARAIAAELPEV